MSKSELPEGFIEVNDFHFTAESVVFVEPDAARRRMIVKAAQFAPAMAEEIKRLREEVEKVTDDRDRLNLALAQAGEWINAALAKPQGAQDDSPFPDTKSLIEHLPAGCEPFDIERAKVEGARTADGRTWYWDGSSREKDGWCFETKNTPSDLWFFNEQGLALKVNDATPFAILYCIAKPVTRPFDLEAALRGEKVVTRDGREIESVSRNPEGSEYALTCVINGCSDYWHEDGSYVEGERHRSDLFMEGGV